MCTMKRCRLAVRADLIIFAPIYGLPGDNDHVDWEIDDVVTKPIHDILPKEVVNDQQLMKFHKLIG